MLRGRSPGHVRSARWSFFSRKAQAGEGASHRCPAHADPVRGSVRARELVDGPIRLFLDEVPTYAFLPPVYYYQGLVREGMKTEKFADSYRAYLAIRGESKEDPLVAEVRRRAGIR